jgi:hypothetical protein
MKKIILFLFIATLAIVSACNKEKSVPATPPNGYWEEMIYVPIKQANGDIRSEQMRWPEMLAAHQANKIDLDTFRFAVRTVEFTPNTSSEQGGTMKVTIHHGDGRKDSDGSALDCGPQRAEFYQIVYKIDDSHGGKNVSSLVWNEGDARFTGSGFGATYPSECSGVGTIQGFYEFSYQDTNPKRMKLVRFTGENEILSTYLLEQRSK